MGIPIKERDQFARMNCCSIDNVSRIGQFYAMSRNGRAHMVFFVRPLTVCLVQLLMVILVRPLIVFFCSAFDCAFGSSAGAGALVFDSAGAEDLF